MTAVEFLMEKVKRHFTTEEIIYFQDVYNQALEMEEQQKEISDEEINKVVKNEFYLVSYNSIENQRLAFIRGAKWYREQLKQLKQLKNN